MRLLLQMLMVPFVLRQSTRRSHDYLDGGTGSMILQILLGGTAGIAVIGRMFWRQVGEVLHFGRKNSDEITVSDE